MTDSAHSTPEPPASPAAKPTKPGLLARLKGLGHFAADNIGAVVVFLVVNQIWGLKAAIAASIVFAVIDALRHWWLRIAFTKVGVVATVLTIGFGLIDLFAATPFMLRFESVISNLMTGAVFAAGARGKRSMLLELVEQKRGAPFVGRPDLVRFFAILTWIWVGYFAIKAGLYLWVGLIVPLDRAIELRAIWGTASLVAMMVVFSALARQLYHLFNRLGWLPPRQDQPNPAA